MITKLKKKSIRLIRMVPYKESGIVSAVGDVALYLINFAFLVFVLLAYITL